MIQHKEIYVPVDGVITDFILKTWQKHETKNEFLEKQENKIVLDLEELKKIIGDAFEDGGVQTCLSFHNIPYKSKETYITNLIKHL